MAAVLVFAVVAGSVQANPSKIAVKQVEASSQFPTDSAHYFPANAVDGDKTTAWFPQRSNRANKGEWIRFDFGGQARPEKVVIINGWVKNNALWRHNSRIAKATLAFSDGSEQAITLADTQEPIEIKLSGAATEWVKLTIDEIYPGKRWNMESGLSEVVFLGQAPVPASEPVRAPAAGSGDAAVAAAAAGPVAGASVDAAAVPGPSNPATPSNPSDLTRAALGGEFMWGPSAWLNQEGLVFLNKQFWQDQPEVGRREFNWPDARQYCRELKITVDGLALDGFDLPSQSDYAQVFSTGLATQFKHNGLASNVQKTYWQSGFRPDPRVPGKIQYGDSISYWRTSETNPYMGGMQAGSKQHARCVSQGGTAQARPLLELAQTMAEYKLDAISRVALPQRPARLPPVAGATLVKGEFEPSADFQKRVATEQARVRSADEANSLAFDQVLKQWEAQVESLKRLQAHSAATRAGGLARAQLEALPKAALMRYGAPRIASMVYDADAQSFRIAIVSERGEHASELRLPVPLALAPRVKELATSAAFAPELDMRVTDTGMAAVGIRQLRDPRAFIVAMELQLKKDSLEGLQHTLATYPGTVHSAQVQARIAELQRVQAQQKLKADERAKAEADEQKRLADERERDRQRRHEPKRVGDKVCAEMSTRGLFSSDTYLVSGHVENKGGERIQIRIIDPRGISHYNGAKLYQGAIIWDEHSHWKACR